MEYHSFVPFFTMEQRLQAAPTMGTCISGTYEHNRRFNGLDSQVRQDFASSYHHRPELNVSKVAPYQPFVSVTFWCARVKPLISGLQAITIPNASSAYLVVATSTGGEPATISIWKLLVEGNHSVHGSPFMKTHLKRSPDQISDTVNDAEPTPEAQAEGPPDGNFRDRLGWLKPILTLFFVIAGITIRYAQQ